MSSISVSIERFRGKVTEPPRIPDITVGDESFPEAASPEEIEEGLRGAAGLFKPDFIHSFTQQTCIGHKCQMIRNETRFLVALLLLGPFPSKVVHSFIHLFIHSPNTLFHKSGYNNQ
jgi:hypothetical protein